MILAVTYNIRHGQGTDNNIDLGRIAEPIAASQCLVACLQEVDSGCDRSDRVDQPKQIARLLGKQWKPVFGANKTRECGGKFGNAVLTVLPLLEHKNFKLPWCDSDDEQRGVLRVTLQAGYDEPLEVFCTHLEYRDGAKAEIRYRQMIFVLDLIQKVPKGRPVLLAGDFNDVPGSPIFNQAIKADLRDAWKVNKERFPGFTLFPQRGRYAPRRIDWIFGNEVINPERACVLASKGSDHLPVYAELAVLGTNEMELIDVMSDSSEGTVE